jgi:hypothetical protein
MNHNEKRADFFYKVSQVVIEANCQGIELMPFRFYSNAADQRKIYEQGKSLTLKSKHLEWLAIDVVILKNGSPVWRRTGEYGQIADIARSKGLFVDSPGGRLDDCYHLEYAE